MGPSIKYVTLEGEGSEKVWQIMTEGGVQEHVTSPFLKKIIHMKPKIESDV